MKQTSIISFNISTCKIFSLLSLELIKKIKKLIEIKKNKLELKSNNKRSKTISIIKIKIQKDQIV